MAEMCETCTLPEELCVCEDVSKSETEVEISVEDRRNNVVTIIEGFEEQFDIESLSSELKKTFACGGTFRDEQNLIELQGNHEGSRLRKFLRDDGFKVS